MINRLQGVVNSKEKKQLLSNFLSLAVLQVLNYLLPLLTVPYLVRTLGVDNFGVLAFATAIITYFNVLTDYGFNLTAAREVSIHRDDKKKLAEIFSSVMIIKFILMIFSFFLLLVLVFIFEMFAEHRVVYLLTFGIVVGKMLFPVWFFQGIEKMKYITYLSVSSNVLFTIAIFVFVRNETDMWLVPLLTSSGFVVTGFYSLYLIISLFKINFEWQSIKTIKFYFHDGWHVFLQQFYVSMYGPINIILLGLMSTSNIVGYYSIAEKVISVPVAFINVAIRAYYPFSVKVFKANIKSYFFQIKKVFAGLITLALLSQVLVYLFDKEILEFIMGNNNVGADSVIEILRILIAGLVFSSLGLFYTQIFITLSKPDVLSRLSFRMMCLNILLSPVLIYCFGVMGLAILVIFRQVFVAAFCFLKIRILRENMLIAVRN